MSAATKGISQAKKAVGGGDSAAQVDLVERFFGDCHDEVLAALRAVGAGAWEPVRGASTQVKTQVIRFIRNKKTRQWFWRAIGGANTAKQLSDAEDVLISAFEEFPRETVREMLVAKNHFLYRKTLEVYLCKGGVLPRDAVDLKIPRGEAWFHSNKEDERKAMLEEVKNITGLVAELTPMDKTPESLEEIELAVKDATPSNLVALLHILFNTPALVRPAGMFGSVEYVLEQAMKWFAGSTPGEDALCLQFLKLLVNRTILVLCNKVQIAMLVRRCE